MTRLILLGLCLAAGPAAAEERTFVVTTDGKSVGELTITFKSQDDGPMTVSYRADVRAEQPVAYSFGYRGTEVWKDGRLVRLDGAGEQGKHKGGITLRAGTDGHHLKARTKEVMVRGEVWPSSFAVLPDPDRRPLVVDVLTGDVLRAKVEKVGPDRVTVAGKVIPATRYRVTAGGTTGDVWYDARGRLVRRAWARDGRAFVAELVRFEE